MDWPPFAGDPRFFRRSGPHSLAAVADAAEAEAPPRRLMLTGVAPLQTAEPTEVSFLDNRKYATALAETRAGAVIVHPDMADRVPPTAVAIVTAEPYAAWARVAALFHPIAAGPAGRASVRGGGAGCRDRCERRDRTAGRDRRRGRDRPALPHRSRRRDRRGRRLGADCRIGAHVTLSHALLGDRVIVYPGARIGQDGFGFCRSRRGRF